MPSDNGPVPKFPSLQNTDKPSPRETTATSVFSLNDPQGESRFGALPQASSRIIEALSMQLSKCTVKVCESGVLAENTPSGIKYKNLPKNLRGATKLLMQLRKRDGESEALSLFIGRTRSTWVLLYNIPHEKIYEDTRFMGIDFKRRDIVELDSGKTMFLSTVTRDEVDLLQSIAFRDSVKKPMPFDTLAPSEESPIHSGSYAELGGKLKAAKGIVSTDPLFNMKSFADGIKFVTTMQDSQGNTHYYIVSGEEEHSYWLYINSPGQMPAACISTTTFTYCADSCSLYQDM